MTTITFTPAVSEIPRDRYGRPMVTLPGETKQTAYRRCTTFIDVVEDKYNLQLWMQRMVATGLAIRPDLALAASTYATDPDANKRELNKLCEDAREAAAASAKATVGTALHALTERLDRGLDVGVIPDQYKKHLASYETATAGLTCLHIEQLMVHDELKVAGTPDRIVTVDGMDGCFIADTKTGPSTLKYGLGKVAMQMAMYSRSVLFNHETNTRMSVPGLSQTAGIVIALNAETGDCDLHWIDLTAGWRGVEVARQVWEYRGLKGLSKPMTPPVDDRAEPALDAAITTAGTVEDLNRLWAAAGPAWTERHTAMAQTRKTELAKTPPADVAAGNN